jgi:predicted amidohydrolase
MRLLKVAEAQYPIEHLGSLDAYEAKIVDWIAKAAGVGAELLVFPEYGAMELTALAGAHVGDLHRSIEVLDRLLPEVDALHQTLARRHGVHILASSAPEHGGDGVYRNIARLFAPSGKIGRQEKLVMTRFERDAWGIVGGGPVTVFRTDIGAIGVSIGYDIEFPLIARAQAEAGAEIILAPSASATAQGHWRARHGARARALENQCAVVQATTVGEANWSPAMASNVGSAGIYGPPGEGFPEDGALAVGEMNKPCWVYADVDLDKVAEMREDGGAQNFRDWAEQGVVTGPVADVVDLGG